MIRSLLAFSSTLRHFALITHLVPAHRVRRLLPEGLELEVLIDPVDGKEKCFISVGSFWNDRFHWKATGRPSLSFEQLTYRTYVKARGRSAVFFFGTYLGTTSSYLLQQAFARDAHLARIRTERRYSDAGYWSYRTEAEGEDGLIRFELKATTAPGLPATLEPLRQHLTYRLHGIARSGPLNSIGGPLADQIVRHRRLSPWTGELASGTFEPWHRLGILEPQEAVPAYSVLVEPQVEFLFYPPLPLALLPHIPFQAAGETPADGDALQYAVRAASKRSQMS